MIDRRKLLAGAALLALSPSLARAFAIEPYDPAKAQAAIAAGKPVVLHVFADWCTQCHAQDEILDRLKAAAAYEGVAVFRVDFDNQKDVVAKLGCPRSTLIAYKAGKEVKRQSFGVTEPEVEDILKAAL
jgi:thiol-disulfide isomerase/thioredoxin